MKNELHRSEAIWLLLSKDTILSPFVTEADEAQFKRRVEAEGIKFLTVSLPALGKALDRSFQTGRFECPEGWLKAKDCAYPAFLKLAWSCLFHPEGTGRWLSATGTFNPLFVSETSMGFAVRCIRQLTYAFYKYEQPWTKDQANEVIDQFKRTEDELWQCTTELHGGAQDALIDGIPLRTYLARAERLIARLLKGVCPKDISPQYGTGATACRSTPWGRWEKPRFIPKLDAVYSVSDWFFSGVNGLDKALTGSRLELHEEVEPLARIVLVPKDSRGPRLISAEPREFMYIQQGLLKALESTIERYPNVRKQVSLIDQERNQWLARFASETGGLATLDLKEASDRVSWWLVTKLFPENWVESFDACRSECTVTPDGEEIPLTKFAPMGSACCFPVEAIVFWALANAARKDWSESRLKGLFDRSERTRDICHLPGLTHLSGGNPTICDVSVFGDDIIVPIDHVDRTVALIEAVGLKVNRHKSYAEGPFRESCGGDYFCGVDVTPVRVKSRLTGDKDINTMLRAKDVLNRISLVYGEYCPTLVIRCRDLFQEFFDLQPPIVSVNHKEGTSGLVLIDYHWLQRREGQTLIKKRETGWCIAKVKTRNRVDNRLKNDYCRIEYRVLTEVAVEATRDLNWSSVLRSFHVSGGRGGADKYAFRKRTRPTIAWLVV